MFLCATGWRGRAAIVAWALASVAVAQPPLPAVWFYRDTFDGESAVVKIAPEETSARPAVPLASLKTLWLIVPAGEPAPVIEFAGRAYALREEGLFRFLRRPEDRAAPEDSGVRNLIFLRRPEATIPFLRAVSRLIAHGSRDEKHATAVVQTRLIDRPWIVTTCGPARDLLAALLRELSPRYQLRAVDTTAAPGPENGFDDGHSVLEIRGGAFADWTLVDIDQGLLFRAGGDRFLDTAALLDAWAKGAAVRYAALSPKEIDLSFLGTEPQRQGYNFAVYEQHVMRYPAERDRWYRRVLQRPRYSPAKD